MIRSLLDGKPVLQNARCGPASQASKPNRTLMFEH